MARERDLLVNFERMRREMDELFGDVWGEPAGRLGRPQSGVLAPRGRLLLRASRREGDRQGRSRGREPRQHRARGRGPRPGDQRRAAHSGDRGPRLPAGRDRGRAVPARHRAERRPGRRGGQGHLRGRDPAGRAAAAARRPPQPQRADRDRASSCGATRWGHPRAGRGAGRRPSIEVVEGADVEQAIRERAGAARSRRASRPSPQGDGGLPGHADSARGGPPSVDAARQRCALGRAHARDGRVQGPGGSRSPGPTSSTTSASPASSREC